MRARRLPGIIGHMALMTAISALSFGCFGTTPTDDDPPPGPYQAAARYSREHSGQGLLVMKGDEIVYEDNQNGGSVDRPYQLFSGTKSFSCAIAAAAVTDGLIHSLDETVANTITEWADDSRKSQITIRQLLNFTSGLSQQLINLYQFLVNAYAFTTGIQTTTDPGAAFAYGEDSLAVFAELMTRKLKAVAADPSNPEDPLDYLKRKVFDPIGLEYAQWFRTAEGHPILSFGAVVSARQWIKYGKLLRDRGDWNGTQVLAGARIDECTTGTAAMPGYGLNLWLNAAMPSDFKGLQLAKFVSLSFADGGPTGLIYPGGPSELFAVVGVSDHRLYMFRTEDLVIARIGHGGTNSGWSDAEFLRAFFGQ